MTTILENVIFIPGQDDSFPDSNAYVIGNKNSNDLSLVDAGLVGKGSYKIKAITEAGINLPDIKRVIMTHAHLDHIGCLYEVLERIPNAELWMHILEAELLEQEDDMIIYGMKMFREMSQMQFKLKPGAFTLKVQRKLIGGEKLNIGGMTWEVIHTPGHSPGGIALYNSLNQILISGDTVYNDYNIGRSDLYKSSTKELNQSLLKLARLKVKILLPGHNRIETNLQASYISEVVKKWGAVS